MCACKNSVLFEFYEIEACENVVALVCGLFQCVRVYDLTPVSGHVPVAVFLSAVD